MRQRDRVRADQLDVATTVTAWVVAPILAAAGIILFGFPGRTERLWAWTIGSQLTAMAVGGGYLAGAWFFARGALAGTWTAMRVGVVGASVLATSLLVVTVVHWDAFNHGHVSFWAWLVLYVVTPVWLPVLVVRNERVRRRKPLPPGPIVERPVRLVAGAAGAVQLAVAVVLFVRPSALLDTWPWPLTPLTARTLSAFLAFIAVVWVAFLREDRWASLALPVESATIGLALVAVAVVIRWQELGDGAEPAVLMLILGGVLAGLVALQVRMRRPAGSRR